MNSAMYSVVLSLVVCMCAVVIFTGHILMLAVITITIIGKWTTFSPLDGDRVVLECCTMGLCGLGGHYSYGCSVGQWGWLSGMECWSRDRKIWVQVLAGAVGDFSSPGSTSCADSYFGIRSAPVLRQYHRKDPAHSVRSAVAGYS